MADPWDAFKADVAGYLGHLGAEEFDYAVNISLKYNYIYVENAKVACSTIKLILQRMELDDPEYRTDELVDMHSRRYSPLCSPARVGGFSRYARRPGVYRFCFVRNPYSRVLSCYLDKICNHMPAKAGVLAALGRDPDDLQQSVSFAEFVQAIAAQEVADMDPHWRVQYHQTLQGRMDYDFIGRFENLEADLRGVLARLNPGYEKYWGVENRHATGSASRLGEYYDAATEAAVYAVYGEDFRAFGYERLAI